ncbi:hypothetical protein N665_0970s0003 [Sinapis alba]|nr:hypothetical protein N665_0970s0003 [Sinapis alba]
MPPRNARAAQPTTTAQRAARRAARTASQASSETESRSVAAPGNGNAARGQVAVNEAVLEELRRYREAYGGQLPNGGVATEAGAVPIPPGVAGNPPPPPPPPVAVAPTHVQGPTYWDMMRHMKDMQMGFFSGKADAIAADNWKRQLERNFVSARCPLEYRKDLAVHHLKDDALVWWEGEVERTGGIPEIIWDNFLSAFNRKYFPMEAVEQMEGRFQDIRQGTRSVREYGDEFNRLRRFAGHYLSERELIRRFLKGMRIELKNSCNIRDYRDIHELIEKAAEQEVGLEEERKLNQAVHANGVKRNHDTINAIGADPLKQVCGKCRRSHTGECWQKVCYQCGQVGHVKRYCPNGRQGLPMEARGGVCFRCGMNGHHSRDCRTQLARDAAGAAEPRVFAAGDHEGVEQIAGMLLTKSLIV